MKTKEEIANILIKNIEIICEKIAQEPCSYCQAIQLDCGRCSDRSRFKLGGVSKLLANKITEQILNCFTN